MQPTQEQLNSFFTQLQGIQSGVESLYKKKGLKYNSATGKAESAGQPIETPVASPKISATDLSTPVATLPQYPQQTYNNLGVSLSGVSNGIQYQKAQEATAQQQLSGKQQAQNYLASLLGQLQNQSTRQGEIIKQEGLDQKKKLAKQLAQDYESSQLAYQNEIDQLEKKSGGLVGGTSQAVSNLRYEQSKTLANKAIQLRVAEGNYTDAVNIVNDKIQSEFQPIKDQIAYTKDLISLYNNDLTDSERVQLTAQVNREEADYKAMQNTKLAISQSLIENNRPDLITKLDAAQSPSEMLQIAGAYGIPISDKLDKQIKYAQLQKLNAEIAGLNNLGQAGVGNQNQIINTADLETYATQYADTGVLPSVSDLGKLGLTAAQIATYAKQIPKANGAIVSLNTGSKPKNLSDKEAEGIAALTEIVQTTIPALQDRFGKINTGVIGGLYGALFTSQDRQDYNTFRQEFLSKLLVARSGAAVTEQEYDRYANLLPGNFNQPFFLGTDGSKKLNSLAESMKNALNSNLSAKQLGVYGYSSVPLKGSNPPVYKKIGELIDIGGAKYKVLADGTLTDII